MATTKDLVTMTAAEVEAASRSLSPDKVGDLYTLFATEDFSDMTCPALRAQAHLYRGFCWAVTTGRDEDIPRLAPEWDKLARRLVRADNGKPADWYEVNAGLLLREAGAGLSYRRAIEFDVCLHEAAHAVVARAVGAPVEEVSRLREYGPAHILTRSAHLPAADRAKISLAAAECDSLAGRYADYSYRTDFAQAREIALGVAATENGAETRINTWRSEVRELLVKRVHEVVAVALALSERYSLTGPELDEVIAGA